MDRLSNIALILPDTTEEPLGLISLLPQEQETLNTWLLWELNKCEHITNLDFFDKDL